MKLLPVSEKIVEFVSDNFNGVAVPPLDHVSSSVFVEFFRKLSIAHKEMPRFRVYTFVGVRGQMFEYIPYQIRYTIPNNIPVNKITMTFKHRTVHIHIGRIENLAKYLKQIYYWFYLADNYAEHKCSKIVNVFINLTPHKKHIPVDGSPINQLNANTAFTTYCQESTEIHIYRHEEWFKALIHESFHSLGLEFSPLANGDTNRQILEMFKVNSEVNLGESYAEIWAEMLNCLIVSYVSTKDKQNYESMLFKSEQLLNIETKFSMYQCVKVLKYNDMTYGDLFTKSGSKYSENTNVLSYYVIKSILMFHKNTFIKWCVTNNPNVLDFRKTIDNVNKYCFLISKLYKTIPFLENMKAVSSISGYNSTLRMTAIEN